MKNKSTLFTPVLLLLLLNIPTGANAFSRMYVFGDSLSDSGASASSEMSLYNLIGGQCDPYHPCPPYDDGRISNGPVAVEYLADAILPGGGMPSNFYNFSVAGSTSGLGNYGDQGSQSGLGILDLPGMAQQIGYFLSSFSSSAGNDALYVVWGGGNDFLTANSAQSSAQNIAGYVGTLAGIGAEYILVPNIPNLGMTPYVQSFGAGVVAAAEGFSMEFNQELASRLTDLSSLFPATHIAQFDTFDFFQSIAADYTAYGFTNATDACVTLLAVCANPDASVFWDDFHPTTQMHALLAAELVSRVPLPSALLFFVSGLVALFSVGLRRSRI